MKSIGDRTCEQCKDGSLLRTLQHALGHFRSQTLGQSAKRVHENVQGRGARQISRHAGKFTHACSMSESDFKSLIRI